MPHSDLPPRLAEVAAIVTFPLQGILILLSVLMYLSYSPKNTIAEGSRSRYVKVSVKKSSTFSSSCF